MRDPFESLIPLNGAKVRLFPHICKYSAYFLLFSLFFLLKDTHSLLQLLIIREGRFQRSRLVIVSGYDVRLQHLPDYFLMTIQFKGHIVFQPSFQSVESAAGLIVIAFKLSRLHQFIKLLLAHRVIGEPTFYDTLLEISIVGITQMELCCRSNRRVAGDVVNDIVKHHLSRI